MEDQKNKVQKEIENWMNSKYKQVDDMCVIGVRI